MSLYVKIPILGVTEGSKLGDNDFKASNRWLKSLKNRHNIAVKIQHD